MKTIILPRNMGKTTALIEQSHLTGETIVCQGMHSKEYIISLAIEKGCDIPNPITFHEFLHKNYKGRHITGFLIDNADLFLQLCTNLPIRMISVSS